MRLIFEFRKDGKKDPCRDSIANYFLTQFCNNSGIEVHIQLPPSIIVRNEEGILFFQNSLVKWNQLLTYVAFDSFMRHRNPQFEYRLECTILISTITTNSPCSLIRPLLKTFETKICDNIVKARTLPDKKTIKLGFNTKCLNNNTIDVEVLKSPFDHLLPDIPFVSQCQTLPDIKFYMCTLGLKPMSVKIETLAKQGLCVIRDAILHVVSPIFHLSYSNFKKLLFQAINHGLRITFSGLHMENRNVLKPAVIEANIFDILNAPVVELEYLHHVHLIITDRSINKCTYKNLIILSKQYKFYFAIKCNY